MNRTITLTRRTLAIVLAVSAVAALVSASVLSTYLLPSHVKITSQPGISIFTVDPSTNTCTTTPLTTFDFGDVQQTQSKAGPTLCISNSGGNQVAYILQLVSPTVLSSLGTQNPLPQGVTLSWNFVSVARGSSESGCPGFNTAVGDCFGINPGSQTPPITLTLSVDNTATPQDLSFTIVFTAYSSQTG